MRVIHDVAENDEDRIILTVSSDLLFYFPSQRITATNKRTRFTARWGRVTE